MTLTNRRHEALFASMEVLDSIRHVMWGLLQIEQEIIMQARARRVLITTTDFSWNSGRSLFSGPLGESIPMEVRAGGRKVGVQWSRTHLKDSQDGVGLREVRQKIDSIVEALAPSQR